MSSFDKTKKKKKKKKAERAQRQLFNLKLFRNLATLYLD